MAILSHKRLWEMQSMAGWPRAQLLLDYQGNNCCRLRFRDEETETKRSNLLKVTYLAISGLLARKSPGPGPASPSFTATLCIVCPYILDEALEAWKG